MTTNNHFIPHIPLTHLLLTCAIASIATALALFFNVGHIIVYGYAIATAIILCKQKKDLLIILFACALFSLQVFFKIQHINAQYHAHQQFLNCPTNVHGFIVQKQNTQLHKDQTTLLIQTSKIYKTEDATLMQPVKILLQVASKRAQHLHEGQSISIFKALLQQPTPDCAYQNYLIKEGVWATSFITSQKILITNEANRSWYHLCSARFTSLLQAATLHLFNPLFLGKREKTIATIDIQHQSLYWGIAHHMARSGIHLVTLFGLFMALFHYIRIRHFYRYLICGLLALGYFEISIASVSFLRAFCMILFQIISKINHFQYSSVHALTLTTLLMVLHNPYYILFLDFQLSFGITAVIIWLFQAKWAKTVAFEPKTLVHS